MGFSLIDTDDSQDSKGREGTIFYYTLPLPLAHEHSDIYLQLCMWIDYHIFLIAPLVFTRLLPHEIYHLIELPFDHVNFVCLLDDLILGFCYSNLRRETSGLKLASFITILLQANRLTKCASNPQPFWFPLGSQNLTRLITKYHTNHTVWLLKASVCVVARKFGFKTSSKASWANMEENIKDKINLSRKEIL